MSLYEELANAIILRAVEDYRRALRKLRRCEGDINTLLTVHELNRSFNPSGLPSSATSTVKYSLAG